MAEILLTGKQSVFVAEYVANEIAGGKLTAQEVAVKAGVSPKTAHVYASRSLADAKIIAAIAERKQLLAERAAGTLDVDAVRVLREWAEIAIADPTQVVTVRRVNCRYCNGVNHEYQFTDAEYAKETADELGEDEPNLDRFIGGGGFHLLTDPHPDCPECAGEGVEDMHVADFRKLKGAAKRLIAGVKMGKHGIEVQFRDQDAALRNLAQYLGLLVNKNEHSGPNGGPIPTANVNYTLPADPVAAARAYQLLMEGNK